MNDRESAKLITVRPYTGTIIEALESKLNCTQEALLDLLDVCERIGPPAITQGGLCEEQDWSTAMRKARKILEVQS